MPNPAQTYASHRRWFPMYHFFVLPILVANVVMTTVYALRHPGLITVWWILVALALLLGAVAARRMSLVVQNRLIRLEEKLRVGGIVPNAGASNLNQSQLIALRFAPDDEVPELVRRIQAGELKSSRDIKRAIKNWRADHSRV